jgi:hypothetical protein
MLPCTQASSLARLATSMLSPKSFHSLDGGEALPGSKTGSHVSRNCADAPPGCPDTSTSTAPQKHAPEKLSLIKLLLLHCRTWPTAAE